MGFHVESFFQELGAKQSARLPVFPRDQEFDSYHTSNRVNGDRTFYLRTRARICIQIVRKG